MDICLCWVNVLLSKDRHMNVTTIKARLLSLKERDSAFIFVVL